MKMLGELFKRKPYLAWYVKNKENLSEASMLEHILNYGTWEDYLEAEEALGIDKVKFLFMEIKTKKRSNLRPRTVNYFSNYLSRYA